MTTARADRTIAAGGYGDPWEGVAIGRLDGKVALITGAARGQGRSHAVRLAEEGAEIVALDICAQVETAPYEMPSGDDLAETVKLVEDLDRRIVAREADVRDLAALQRVVEEGISEFGHIDVVCANAGIGTIASAIEMDELTWDQMIGINLTGVWKTIKAAIPPMIERGQGGAIIITSSVAGLFGFPNLAHSRPPSTASSASCACSPRSWRHT